MKTITKTYFLSKRQLSIPAEGSQHNVTVNLEIKYYNIIDLIIILLL